MNEASRINKAAWEFDAYAFWCRHNGLPHAFAAEIAADPRAALRRFADDLLPCKGQRIANICGSCGKKALPLALLGADVTVFDISESNARYAREMASAAGVPLTYHVGDVLDIDPQGFGGQFDMVFMEGGILAYFHDIDRFMQMMRMLLRPGGRMVLSDFHPFTKVQDTLGLQLPTMSYFCTDVFEGEMAHARFYNESTRHFFPNACTASTPSARSSTPCCAPASRSAALTSIPRGTIPRCPENSRCWPISPQQKGRACDYT